MSTALLERLALALEHLEAAAEGDVGRAGLAYIQLLEAHAELAAELRLAEQHAEQRRERLTFVSPEDQRAIAAAVERTQARRLARGGTS